MKRTGWSAAEVLGTQGKGEDCFLKTKGGRRKLTIVKYDPDASGEK